MKRGGDRRDDDQNLKRASPKGARRWLAGMVCAGLVFLEPLGFSALQASGESEALHRGRVRLNRTVRQLVREREALQKTRGTEKNLLGELDLLDQELAAGDRRQEKLEARTAEMKKRIPVMEQRVRRGRMELGQRQQRIGAHIRVIYGLGGQGLFKVAFSQDSPTRVRQGILYYGLLIQSRNEQFRGFQNALAGLRTLIQEHQTLMNAQRELSLALGEEQNQRRQHWQERTALLARVQREKDLHQQKVEALQRAREAMDAFVAGMAKNLAPPAADPETTQLPITRRKGKLPPPVSGRVRARSPGLFYRVAKNSPVQAIHKGQVVYADWFRGYGRLLILNHGEHVYSLYGHNRKLLVEQGNRVGAGDPIAKTGDSGSLDGVAGLYFEIRHQGKATNPKVWLAK